MNQISGTIKNSQRIEDVVAIINKGGTYRWDENEIAGQYAYDAIDTIDDWDEKDREDNFETAVSYHFQALKNNGAKFDEFEAMIEAKKHFWNYCNN